MPNQNIIAAIKTRAVLNRYIREFFHARGVLEVETPILSQAGNTDPNIESFTTEFNGAEQHGAKIRWLRTSPEFPIKRLLAEGIGDCFELGKVFRNGECGRNHNPEFTMLEWYRVGWDHHQLAAEVVEFIDTLLKAVGKVAQVKKQSYAELFADLKIDPHRENIENLHVAVAKFVMTTKDLNRDDCLHLLLTQVIEPKFESDCIRIIYDFPESQCALAKKREQDGVVVAERFEIYFGSIELANGYHELTDADEQLKRFVSDNTKRKNQNATELPIDHRLIEALKMGMPPCAGVALGVDRLLIAITPNQKLADVLTFSFPQS